MKKLLSLLSLMTITFATTAQVANDNCSNATVLQINPNLTQTLTTPGTVAGATASPEANTCAGSDDDDVWYQFTATSTSHQINITNITGSSLDLNHVVYQGNDCSALTQKYCSNPNNSTATGLTIGQTYKIRVYTATSIAGQTTTFDISITTPPAPPVNDNCANATTLTVNPFGDTTITATSTLYQSTKTIVLPSSNCGNENEDVWFKFIATGTKQKITTTNISGSIDGMNYAIYSGNCEALAIMTCLVPDNIIVSLVPGQTYYIRAYSWEGVSQAPSSFTISLSNLSPANDSCISPVVLIPGATPNCSGGLAGDLTFASPTTGLSNTFCGYNNSDVWYEFTATSTTHYVWLSNIVGSTINNVRYAIYSGNCTELTYVKCSNNDNAYPQYTSYIPGQVYKIRVYKTTSQNIEITFNICIGTLTAPPVNDNCATAVSILASTTNQCTQTISGTIAGATASPEALYCEGTPDDDVWYTFVATSTQHTISMTNAIETTPDLTYAVYYDYPCAYPNFASIKSCYSTYYNGSTFNFEVGQTYKIRVFSKTANPFQTSFNLCITTPNPPVVPPAPANDLCANAITLPVNPTLEYTQQLNGTAQYATSTTIAGCGQNFNDVWYQFTATSKQHIVQMLDANGHQINNVGLYTGNCSSLTPIKCLDSFFSGLTIGQNYKVRAGYGASDFTICVTTPPSPPVNDECTNATIIPVNSGFEPTLKTFGTLKWALSTAEGTPRSGDVWYQFTALHTTHYVNIEQLESSNLYLGIELFNGTNCSTMTQIPSEGNPTKFTGLVPGNIYKLKVIMPSYVNEAIDFNISILTEPQAPVNDLCINPTLLPVTAGTSCQQSTNGTFTMATLSDPVPQNSWNNSPDVWYEFTATHSTQNIFITDIVNVNIAGIEILEGNCGALINKGPFNPKYEKVITGLVPGNTYKIRVVAYLDFFTDTDITSSFKICLTEPDPAPVNDECSAAILLPVNAGLICETAINGTLLGATKSSESLVNALNYNRDVWYKFTATSTRHHINISSDKYLTHILYSGSGCGAFTPLYTKNNINSIATNLTIGQVYWIRVLCSGITSNEQANFTICIGTPVPATNDECSNAITITVNPGEEVVNFIEGSGQLATANGCSKDLWYKFTATSTLHYIDLDVDNTNYVEPYIYSANDCSSIICGNTSNRITLKNGYAPNLIPGQTYYIMMVAANDLPGELSLFRLAITTPQAPAGDTCASPITIPVNSNQECTLTYTGNLQQATDTANIPDLCFVSSPDLWVKFTATSNSHIIKMLSNTEGSNNNKVYYSVFAGDDCNITEDSCISYDYETPINCVIGETYRIRIRLRNTAQQYLSVPVELCVTTPATCSNPEPFISGYNEYVFDTDDSIPYQTGLACQSTISNAKWFALNITNPGDIEYTLSVNSQYTPQGEPIGVDMSSFSYTVWGPFENTEQGCENLSNANILRCQYLSSYDYEPQTARFTIPDAQTGQYYIIVAGYTPPANFTSNAYIKFEQTGGNAMSGNVPAPTGDTTQAFGTGQTLADIEMNDDVTWYDNPGEPLVVTFSDNDDEDEPEVPLPLTTPLVNGATYYAAKKIYNIESFVRLAVTVNFAEETPAPTGLAEQDFYNGETLANLEVTGQNIKWYNNNEATVALPLNTLLTDGASYSASQTIDGLESIQRFTVTVNEIITPAPAGAAIQYYVQGETLASLEVTGENIKWYSDSTSTEPLPATTTLVDGNTYYASQTINGVESSDRLAVTTFAIVITVTPPPTGAVEQAFTEGETLANVEVTGENIKWYAGNLTTEVLPIVTPLADGATYYASQTIDTVESIQRLAVTVNLILGTGSNTFATLQYYPNPATDILNIENGNNIDSLSIVNALGQKVLSKTINSNIAQADFSSLSRGVYFVTITSGSASTTIKILKE